MRKKITENKIAVLGGLLVFVFAACNDMTTLQYHNQQAAEQLAREQAAAGTWVGSMNSLDEKTLIGGLQIGVNVSATPVSSSDTTSTTTQAEIHGSVKIIGPNNAEAAFDQGAYDPDTGKFSATIPLPADPDGTVPVLTLSATISGTTMTGTITSDQEPGAGGSFTAQLNGQLPDTSGITVNPVAIYFTGTFADSNPYCGTISHGQLTLTGTCAVDMSIQDPHSSSADSFGDLFILANSVLIGVSIHPVLTDSDSASLALAASNTWSLGFGGSSTNTGQFDQRNKTLYGRATSTGTTNITNNISCNEVLVTGNPNGQFGWACEVDSTYRSIQKMFSVIPSAKPAID